MSQNEAPRDVKVRPQYRTRVRYRPRGRAHAALAAARAWDPAGHGHDSTGIS